MSKKSSSLTGELLPLRKAMKELHSIPHSTIFPTKCLVSSEVTERMEKIDPWIWTQTILPIHLQLSRLAEDWWVGRRPKMSNGRPSIWVVSSRNRFVLTRKNKSRTIGISVFGHVSLYNGMVGYSPHPHLLFCFIQGSCETSSELPATQSILWSPSLKPSNLNWLPNPPVDDIPNAKKWKKTFNWKIWNVNKMTNVTQKA